MDLKELLELLAKLEGTKKPKKEKTKSALIGKFVIIRTYSAGVHAGTLIARNGKEVLLNDAYRIWSWTQPETNTGSLNAVAVYGPGSGSKIGNKVPNIELTEAIEIIECTEVSKTRIVSGKWS